MGERSRQETLSAIKVKETKREKRSEMSKRNIKVKEETKREVRCLRITGVVMRESRGERCGHSHDVPKLKEVLETVTEVVVRESHRLILWADSQLPQCSIGRKAFIEEPNPFPPLTHFTKGPFWWALGPFLRAPKQVGTISQPGLGVCVRVLSSHNSTELKIPELYGQSLARHPPAYRAMVRSFSTSMIRR